MSTETAIPAELVKKLEETLARVAQGVRDPHEMKDAGAEMDRMREELRRQIGIVDVAVDLVRDARNQ